MYRRQSYSRGVSLLDAVVGVALMLMVFTGISGVFKLSIELVSNNKARVGALALAQERLEYVHSLGYSSIGTQGGIPSGPLQQIDQTTLNAVQYTRRVLVRYIDDPKDGTGAADTNHITADAKEVKVEVSWTTRGALRTASLVSRISPVGIEQAVPGGTLSLYVVNAQGQAVTGALVDVVNTSTSVDTQAYSDVDGLVQFIGTPSGTGYRITVTKNGYSSAQTYTASSTNPSPSPGHLTVVNNQTTSATFAVDATAAFTIQTFDAIQTRTWTDTFSNGANIYTSASTTVSGGAVMLSGSPGSYEPEGFLRAVPVAVSYLAGWREIRFTHSTPANTAIRYYVYQDDSGTLVPDAALPGNSNGFTVSPINISSISTSTYTTLRVGARLTTLNPNNTPQIQDWHVDYDQGPVPLPNLSVHVRGAKQIGTNAGAPVYKYSLTQSSGAGATISLPTAEWDTYTLTVPGTTYDIARSCNPQPTVVAPGSTVTTALHMLPHTTNSLLVDVSDANDVPITNASVRLYRGAYTSTQTTVTCGQSFYSNLSSGTVSGGNPYSVQITASGYQTYTSTQVDVSGASRLSVTLTP